MAKKQIEAELRGIKPKEIKNLRSFDNYIGIVLQIKS